MNRIAILFAAVALTCFVGLQETEAQYYGRGGFGGYGGRGVSVSFGRGFNGGFNNFNRGFNSFNSFGRSSFNRGFGGFSSYRPSYGGFSYGNSFRRPSYGYGGGFGGYGGGFSRYGY